MPTAVLTKRYTLVDILRGLAVIAMIAYHTIWDLVYVHGVEVGDFGAYTQTRFIIQRTIRWSFIILSGFCFQMGKRKLKRGLTVLGGGVIITLVTMVVMPDYPIHLGVLTFIGSAMVLCIPLDRVFRHVPGWLGFGISLLLFLATEHVPEGLLGQGSWTVAMPQQLYSNYFTAWLGMPSLAFYSSDYVPVIPWLFSFWMGYFAYSCFKKWDMLQYLSCLRFEPLEWVGRNALIIYMLHQPVIYGVLYVIFLLIR